MQYVPLEIIREVRRGQLAADARPSDLCGILADLCRINTLYMIMRAGSGHIGSSFSSMDIITWLWTQELSDPNRKLPQSDVYFSSKGHDAPALYALLIALERLDFDLLHKLRRFGGLPGHPDVETPGIATNTGSLGMGISKACGMVRAKRLRGEGGRVYVMTGDGELQEGQIWESLQPASNDRLHELTVIVDRNRLQSDSAVADVSDLGPIEAKFRAFGWDVSSVDGHDFGSLARVFTHVKSVSDAPQIIIANTIKGRGVSFMEGLASGEQTYRFHAGAPSRSDYLAATAEILARVNDRLAGHRLGPIALAAADAPQRVTPSNPERLVAAYGDELLKLARERKDIVVLDADLLSDCGIEGFKHDHPGRFIECGIAEQHMVSSAGGLALGGMLPIVHSFASFLSARANEQIYNNATERTRIIYVGTLAGMIPGGPGHSHQSVRDISALGSIPGLIAIEPGNELEARLAIRWAVDTNPTSTYLRFVNVPLDLPYTLPNAHALHVGRGVFLRDGSDGAIVGAGPVLLSNACRAADALATQGISVAVIDLPWLNRLDAAWVADVLHRFPVVVTLDNHYVALGQGVMVASALARSGAGSDVLSIGLTDVPVCGSNDEVLAYHGLDDASIVRSVMKACDRRSRVNA